MKVKISGIGRGMYSYKYYFLYGKILSFERKTNRYCIIPDTEQKNKDNLYKLISEGFNNKLYFFLSDIDYMEKI